MALSSQHVSKVPSKLRQFVDMSTRGHRTVETGGSSCLLKNITEKLYFTQLLSMGKFIFVVHSLWLIWNDDSMIRRLFHWFRASVLVTPIPSSLLVLMYSVHLCLYKLDKTGALKHFPVVTPVDPRFRGRGWRPPKYSTLLTPMAASWISQFSYPEQIASPAW